MAHPVRLRVYDFAVGSNGPQRHDRVLRGLDVSLPRSRRGGTGPPRLNGRWHGSWVAGQTRADGTQSVADDPHVRFRKTEVQQR
jgi:hypothetical protein